MSLSDLPVAGGDAHKKAFERLGWAHDRTKSSHHIMVKDGFNPLSIPCHKGRDVKRALLAKLLEIAKISEQDYLAAFRGKKPGRGKATPPG